MKKSPIQQSVELIEKSQDMVIILPGNPTTDAVASGLGFFMALEKRGKKAKVVCSDFSLPPQNQFLPKSEEIHSDLTALRKFVITLDISRAQVSELSYDISSVDKKLNIFITPKNGFFESRDISTSATKYEYDLIIVLDSPNLESLGKIYDNNAEFFYNTPIINIDHNPANEFFGTINVVDLVATSTSEIVFEMLKEFKDKLLNEYIATSLLTGIISKTKSFQAANVTPRSLAISSHLIENGARRDDIIKHLYRTKSINMLKLWGRALARLKTDMNNKVVWSLLNCNDFEKSGAKEADLEGVVDELIINTPGAEVVALFYESPGDKKIRVVINTVRAIDGLAMFKDYHPQGTRNFTKFSMPQSKSLLQAEEEILRVIKNYLKEVIGY